MINTKYLLTAVLLAAVVSMSIVLIESDDADAASDEYFDDVHMTVGKYSSITYKDMFGLDGGNSLGDYGGNLPAGVSVKWDSNDGFNKKNYRLEGTPENAGTYDFWVVRNNVGYPHWHVNVIVAPATYTVTYHGVIGTVNGASTWTEQILENSYASLPSAQYSSGAYSFVGWATSSGSASTVSSVKVTANTDLYAVYSQNSTTISPWSATVTQGQSVSHTFTVLPSEASVSITSTGGLSGLRVTGKTLSGTVNASPGTYYVVLSATASGYKVATTTVAITVPVVIVPPIEYHLTSGQTFSFEPTTNPSHASVSISKVTKDGTTITNQPLSVVGRSITGVLTDTGTYAVTFSCSASGYVGVSKTVFIYVSEPPVVVNPPSIGSLTVVERADEPRTYDLIASGTANAVNYEFFVNGVRFSSSSLTAVYEVTTSGIYTFTCDAIGSDGRRASASASIVCVDTYHQDMAWAGVEYCYIKEVSGTDPVISVAAPFVYEFKDAGGKRYLMITGTPDESDIGSSFDIVIGSEAYPITVYAKEDHEPIPDFDIEVSETDGRTVTVTFTGLYASKILWDYGDGVWVMDTTHIYTSENYYTIRCQVINNVAERIMSKHVEIGIVEKTYLSLDELTDFVGYLGDAVIISIDKEPSDTLTIGGSAAEFLTVSGDTIYGHPSAIGEYDLDIVLTRSDSEIATGTINVVILEKDDDESEIPWLYIILGGLVIVGICIAIVLYNPNNSIKTKGKRSKHKGR